MTMLVLISSCLINFQSFFLFIILYSIIFHIYIGYERLKWLFD